MHLLMTINHQYTLLPTPQPLLLQRQHIQQPPPPRQLPQLQQPTQPLQRQPLIPLK